MCGIVGFTGYEQAAPILLDGLAKLEYRGYDSAGIAIRDGVSDTKIVKAKGRLKILAEKTDNGNAVIGSCGIGHTRWATHGEPSEDNAHPHMSDDGNIVAVHNGIIENYQELKEKLSKNGYTFYSQTDTEIAVKLIDYYCKKYGLDPVAALARAMLRIRGSYALAVMFKDYPEEIYVARKDSPMIIGLKDGASYIASDVPAILKYTNKVYYIGNMEIAKLGKGEVTFYNIDREEIEKPLTEIKWDAEAAEKGGYEHFMLKEIHEQPRVIQDTFNSVVKDGKIVLGEFGLTDEEVKDLSQIYIVACGSAYHVGVCIQYVIEQLTTIPVRVELASEFRYRKMPLAKNSLAIIISQSGETADSRAALTLAKENGVKTLGIVNVVGSNIARDADNVFYTLAGPEISVATTKAYSTQLIAGYLLAMQLAKVREEITEERLAELLAELQTIPKKVEKILEDKERIQWFASKFANIRDAFFIGRGIDYAVSLEGSLKMKEISYIHSEAYAAGELKHGPISLIEDGTLVISVLTQQNLFEKTVSNMVECKARGAYIMGLTTYGNYSVEDNADFTAYIPKTDPLFTASLAVVPLQLLGYYISVAKGLDVDKPRNLAKSVTVE
ncbi:glucosamine--fructose-6-phosphate aminotransferase (isomerizing) [Ruminococcus sp. YE71]|uniref:glutamine--fructose-6-phosphate transaminase (isomerizing) n=1 Tax=unclassified Ruminococcus TaxID=2608920 RepID=UPI00087E57D3|nr:MULTISPECIES: glutamine--fructose-6-phosphate transaminase (isomerizing) [unclassified Ruminococcus]SDA14003.1 glucosamine--fructose-6-phosphate aminotransferase (isomerizing) [Ruminococcus sp. YE78]SFW20300.1 glucosamine--fructose-6-phosphate aminotransferase (isomerizing) [Ruminococcus sp. YE71]